MRQVGNLVGNIKKNVEKLARHESHLEYLHECKEKSVIPRGLNLVKLVKSQILWESKEKTFGILFESSNKLLDQEVTKWESKKVKLEQQNKNFLSKLKELLPGEMFMEEREVPGTQIKCKKCKKQRKTR